MATKKQTVKEHQKLIETLKFTPRTYKISLWGYGGEYTMGTVDREIYNYFKNRRLDLMDFSWDSDYTESHSIPEEMWPFPPGSWYECDDMGHTYGVDRNVGTLQIEDETGEIIYERSLEEIDGYSDDSPELNGGEEIWVEMKPAGTVVFLGISSEKGTFFEGDIELTEPFDITKLTLTYDEIDGNEIIKSVSYKDQDIDNRGGSTNGKSSEFGFYTAGSSKDGVYEKYRNMDDITYGLTDWFSKKVNPVRIGLYNVKTAGKNSYTYQACWTGKKWEQTWGDPPQEVKIKEWQGIAYDPDEQYLRDELDNIVSEFSNFPTADEIDDLEHVHCTRCVWSGHEKECNTLGGEICCPSCGEPIEFTN